MATTIKSVRCLLCGWHHPIEHKGSKRLLRGEDASMPKGMFTFNKGEPGESTFISIRECRGRGKGLPEVEKITLKEAMSDPEYQELITSLQDQCMKILKILVSETK